MGEAMDFSLVMLTRILPQSLLFNWWSYALQISCAIWHRGV